MKNISTLERIDTIVPNQPDDLFICCTSFEERCITAASRLAPSYKSRVSCIFRFMPSETDQDGFDATRDRNAVKLSVALRDKTLEMSPILVICDKMSTEDGIGQMERILSSLFANGCRTATIDMSCFTKIYFWEVLHLLTKNFSIEHVQVLYTQSRSIPTNALTAGAHPPSLIPKFAGRFSPTRRTLLVGFVGFEPQRAILIYEEFEPERAELFVSNNTERVEYFSRALKANEYILTRPGVRWAQINPYDLGAALAVLEQAITSPWLGGNEAKNVIFMSLGTKIQNLAGYLFWCRHQEVRLAYSFPTRYASDHLRLNPGKTFLFRLGAADFFGGEQSSQHIIGTD